MREKGQNVFLENVEGGEYLTAEEQQYITFQVSLVLACAGSIISY